MNPLLENVVALDWGLIDIEYPYRFSSDEEGRANNILFYRRVECNYNFAVAYQGGTTAIIIIPRIGKNIPTKGMPP